jgi:hypothetical protein
MAYGGDVTVSGLAISVSNDCGGIHADYRRRPMVQAAVPRRPRDGGPGTPFTVDMLTANRVSGGRAEIWPQLRRRQLGVDRNPSSCASETSIDGKTEPRAVGRFRGPEPTSKRSEGARTGCSRSLARALVDMAQYVSGVRPVRSEAGQVLSRLRHSLQYDLQHFLADPNYFLERR